MMESEYIVGTTVATEVGLEGATAHQGEGDEDDVHSEIARAIELIKEGENLKSLESRLQECNKIQEYSKSEYYTYVEKELADCRSIFVGNVDYSATEADLQEHFLGAGSTRRITILRNKFNGHPKGCAYIEFEKEESVVKAIELNDSLFKGRIIQVLGKRTNIPGRRTERVYKSGYRGGRGGSRGFRGSSRGAVYIKPTRPRSQFVYRRSNPY